MDTKEINAELEGFDSALDRVATSVENLKDSLRSEYDEMDEAEMESVAGKKLSAFIDELELLFDEIENIRSGSIPVWEE